MRRKSRPRTRAERTEAGDAQKSHSLGYSGIMLLAVDTSPGLHGDPEPCAFKLGASNLLVLEIVDRWLGQGEHYFKLQASDAGVYILRHNLIPDTWELTLFQSPSQQP